MSYKRFIKIKGKSYGPYVYTSHREGDKVISTYGGIAKEEKALEKKNQQEKRFLVILSLLIIINMLLAFFLISKISVLIKPSITGLVDWTMFRGGLNHTGYTTDSGPTSSVQAWNFTAADWIDSSPAVANDIVYIGSYDSNIYAINATTGAQKWSYATGSLIASSSPAVASGIVYVGSRDNKIYAINATTGTKKWDFTTAGDVDSSPAVANGIVYVGSNDNKVYALNATNGSQIWNYTAGNYVESSPAVANGIVYIGSWDNKTYALNATNGSRIWNYTASDAVRSSPAVANDIVYIGSSDKNVTALNATNGSLIWNYTAGGAIYSSPAVANDIVYVGSNDQNVYALNATNGSKIWNYTTTGGAVRSSSSISNGVIYFGSDSDKVYALNATNGSLIWSYTTGGDVFSSPAVINNILYVGADDSKVYAIGILPDTTSPYIAFGTGTENNGTAFNRNWIYVNVTVTEVNEANITFNLYNTSLFNSTVNTTAAQRTINWTSLADGTYYYNVTIYDTSSNSNSTPTRTITLDRTNPAWSSNLTNASNNVTKTNNVVYFNITFVETNPGTYIFATNQTGSWVNYSGSYTNNTPIQNITTISADENKFISWYFWANDSAGNSNQSNVWNFTTATVAPTWSTNQTNASSSTRVGDSVYFRTTFADSNPHRYIFATNQSGTWVNYSGTYASGVASQNITTISANETAFVSWYFWANDTFGNTNQTDTWSFRVANVSPTWSNNLTNLSAIIKTNDVVYFNITFTETNPDKYVFAINQTGNWVNYSGNYQTGVPITNITTITATDDTFVAWYFWANDSFGNVNQTNVWNFTVGDNVPPYIAFGTGTESNNTAFNRTWIYVNVSVIESEEANITFNLYNTSLANSTANTSASQRTINWTSLAEGIYYYNVTIYDNSSNSNSTPTRTITLDRTNPSITLFSCTPASVTQGETVTCSCTATDNLDTSLAKTFTANPSTATAGTFTTTCTATDDAGNINSTTTSYTVNTASGGEAPAPAPAPAAPPAATPTVEQPQVEIPPELAEEIPITTPAQEIQQIIEATQELTPVFEKEAVNVAKIQVEKQCIPSYQCSEWSGCMISYDLKGNAVGTKTRTCSDSSGCLPSGIETQSCTLEKVDITTETKTVTETIEIVPETYETETSTTTSVYSAPTAGGGGGILIASIKSGETKGNPYVDVNLIVPVAEQVISGDIAIEKMELFRDIPQPTVKDYIRNYGKWLVQSFVIISFIAYMFYYLNPMPAIVHALKKSPGSDKAVRR